MYEGLAAVELGEETLWRDAVSALFTGYATAVAPPRAATSA
jgi:hypothetical protein